MRSEFSWSVLFTFPQVISNHFLIKKYYFDFSFEISK